LAFIETMMLSKLWRQSAAFDLAFAIVSIGTAGSIWACTSMLRRDSGRRALISRIETGARSFSAISSGECSGVF
jgi:hypothetical protein